MFKVLHLLDDSSSCSPDVEESQTEKVFLTSVVKTVLCDVSKLLVGNTVLSVALW